MPWYFIDSLDGNVDVVDYEGQDLPDDETARTMALKALPDMAKDRILEGDERLFSVFVRRDGHTIFSSTLTLRGGWLKANK